MDSQLMILLDILIAAVLGGLVGLEREWLKKPAGLRTNMIIASSSAFFVSLGRIIIIDFEQLIVPDASGVDPIRMLHAVLVGVSFIGAGTILKGGSGTEVRYLTTAATILMASAIGISVALNQYLLAVGATVLLLLVNIGFNYLNRLIRTHSKHWPDHHQYRSEDEE